MIPETIILNLQFAATILMGIDYFISEKRKKEIDAYLKLKIEYLQQSTDNKMIVLTNLLRTDGYKRFKKSLIYLILCISTTIVTGLILGKYILSEYVVIIYLIGIIILMVLSYFFIKHFSDFIVKNILVFVIPIIFRIFTTFILFVKKGILAGLGILILLISFGCRYYNNYYL
ncbi:hypothetical protein [Aliarcobacter butzleri]|uniref:hypothetical protein n=1 Tax=Aliarcobacter butzleri TaxID=28197 RepID=UPI001EDD5BBE|nr:hypothetical protein [Aliarcobacter butzleri]MCG3680123.1 hypothetical protein [Aliarcobacter butzleri]